MTVNKKTIEDLVGKHSSWRANCLNMIASENVASPSVRRLLSADPQNRYGNAYYPVLSSNSASFEEKMEKYKGYRGQIYLQQIEKAAIENLQELFRAEYADYRPLSGNLCDVASVWAFTRPGDAVMTTPREGGGYDPLFLQIKGLKRKLAFLPFDAEEFNIDIDKAQEEIRRIMPRLIIAGASVILFPVPMRELKEVAGEVDATLCYDAAHVLGLIAGKCLQDPLREGAAAMFGSTAKTFPGPQGGVFLSNGNHEFLDKEDQAMCPTLISNYHQAKVAALALAAAEMIEFGGEYASQVVKNAKALAAFLVEEGFDIHWEEKGYTETHQVLLDVKETGKNADETSDLLEAANIITNPCSFPWDREGMSTGLRLGMNELTRTGMKEQDMKDVAVLFRRCLMDREAPRSVAEETVALKKQFRRIHYSFDDGADAYT